MTVFVIGDRSRQFLLAGGVIRTGYATLRVEGWCEPRFVMTGKSGRHSLLTTATDAARLDAHWRGFLIVNRNLQRKAYVHRIRNPR